MDESIKTNAAERVSEVLKSELEKQLVDEKDAVVLAGHGSHIVTNQLDPADRRGGDSEVVWDDKRFNEFLDRLGVLDKVETT